MDCSDRGFSLRPLIATLETVHKVCLEGKCAYRRVLRGGVDCILQTPNWGHYKSTPFSNLSKDNMSLLYRRNSQRLQVYIDFSTRFLIHSLASLGSGHNAEHHTNASV